MLTAGPRPGPAGALLLAVALWPRPAQAVPLPAEQFELANGMRFVLLERPNMPTVEAGWVVATGVADDPSGATGLSHFVEHMMFKGSRTIGSLDIETELSVLERLAALEDALATEHSSKGPPAGTRREERRRAELEEERHALDQQASRLARLGAFPLEYSRAGATRLNANTAEDLTLYYVTLPAEAIELWFWLESDRLLEPVFREFTNEKAVVAEERSLRVASTPTGEADLAFDAAFWRGAPYANPPLGRAEDLESLRRGALERFVSDRYHPEAITAVLVGSFDPVRVRRLAEAYFGRLAARPSASARAAANPEREHEEILRQACRCPPQVRVRYPTVAFGHRDQFALQALAGLLNGRAGRLYRNLVLGREIAFAAFAQQTPLRRAGMFTVTLESKAGTPSAELVRAWDGELAALLAEPPSEPEMERVARRLATEHLDQLKDPHLLMRRLLVYAGLGDWRQLATWTETLAAVSPQDVVDVARRYLVRDRRLIGIFERDEDGR